MPESPNPGQSYEAWIESKAGACPPEVDGGPDWPMPEVPDWSEEESDDPDAQ